jgi:dihydropyrimidinase
MSLDLVISGGTVITPDHILQADIGVKDGIITQIAEDLRGEENLDARDCYVIPGAIDPHVHLNMPTGTTFSSDTWETGTKAAACGGTTTVIDFIEPEEGQQLREALDSRRREAGAGSVLDFGLHMTVTNADPVTLDQIPDLISKGVTSFKLYTTYPGFLLDDYEMLEVMTAIHQAGGMVLIHCESDAIVQYATAEVVKKGLLDPASHPVSRPPEAEEQAINRVLSLASLTKVPVYIVHISTAGGTAALARAQSQGQVAWGETCPQYLVLNDEKYKLPGFEGAKYVCSPPLRTEQDMDRLWKGLAEGTINSIGTDHCPFFYQGQKELGREDFRSIPGGLPGIQSRLELLYTYGVVGGHLSINQWVDYCCSNPARIFGIAPRKGSIQKGADADLVIFDPHHKKTITQENLREEVDYTPYEGLPLEGSVQTTIAKGKVIAYLGDYSGKNQQGLFLSRLPAKEIQ